MVEDLKLLTKFIDLLNRETEGQISFGPNFVGCLMQLKQEIAQLKSDDEKMKALIYLYKGAVNLLLNVEMALQKRAIDTLGNLVGATHEEANQ
jgi:hypothetical protein